VVADVLVFLAVVAFPVVVAGLVLLADEFGARRYARQHSRGTRRARRGGRHRKLLAVLAR
jgi:hypothetical protein